MIVWGGISHNGKTQLVTVNGILNAQKYKDDILAPVVLPFMQAGNGLTLLQQDNTRPHTARANSAVFDGKQRECDGMAVDVARYFSK